MPAPQPVIPLDWGSPPRSTALRSESSWQKDNKGGGTTSATAASWLEASKGAQGPVENAEDGGKNPKDGRFVGTFVGKERKMVPRTPRGSLTWSLGVRTLRIVFPKEGCEWKRRRNVSRKLGEWIVYTVVCECRAGERDDVPQRSCVEAVANRQGHLDVQSENPRGGVIPPEDECGVIQNMLTDT